MAKQRVVALTTTDNPFDPIDDFSNWYNYDSVRGYGTSEYLARLVPSPNTEIIPSSMLNGIKEQVIDNIVRLLPETYMKVVKEMEVSV